MGKSTQLLAKIIEKELAPYGRRKELAKLSGLSGSQLDRYSRAESSPSLDNLDALAQALGIPAWQLIKPDPPALSPHQREILTLISSMDDKYLGPYVTMLRELRDLLRASKS